MIFENVDLKPYNTFNINAKAKYFANVKSIPQLKEVITFANEKKLEHFILGEGSNILFTKDFDGIIIKNSIDGIDILEEDENTLLLKVGAGVVWDDLVAHAVKNNWGGIENLTLIPGTVGAAPVQNIGAYGVEVKDVLEKVDGIYRESGIEETIPKAECQFGYRDSLFKNRLKNKFIITYSYFRLNKNPEINLEYRALKKACEEKGSRCSSISEVRELIKEIRESKLPDPQQLGNAGSFFKNPVIDMEHFLKLQKEFPNIVSFPIDDKSVKVPAGWLIEQTGLKGKRVGNTGTHKDQALVVVNYGNATGDEILSFAKLVQEKVFEKFEIEIHPEVNII